MSIHTLRKRFVKDGKLPIQVMQSPYFEYFLDLYDPLFGCKFRYDLFMTEVEQSGGEEAYLSNSHKLVKTIVDHVNQKDAYRQFNDPNDHLNAFQTNLKTTKENIYNPSNHGKRFLSVDLEKANFNALRYFSAEIVDGIDDYETWISQFTSIETTKSSKHVRQVIFGNLNPSRQIKIQKYIMGLLADLIQGYYGNEVGLAKMKSASSDELVIELGEDEDVQPLISHLETESSKRNIPIHCEIFALKNLSEDHPTVQGYVKEFVHGGFQLKTVPDIFYATTYKTYLGMDLQNEDHIFYHEGKLAQFLT